MEFFDKIVLVRVDFNVPMQSGIILDDTRIKIPFNTVKNLQKQGAKVVLMSHLGNPGTKNEELSLKQVIPSIEKIYGTSVFFIENYLDENARNIIKNVPKNSLVLLENLRFHIEEENCDLDFAKKLASLGDYFINEAFSVSHRKHASIFGIPQFLPSELGENFRYEIKTINKFFANENSKKMGIIGGSKLSTKVKLLKSLVKKVDRLALGGGIAGAFAAYLGNTTLKIFDPKEYSKDVEEIMKNAEEFGCELILPIDFSALISTEDSFDYAIISSENDHASVFDVGPKTVELLKKHISESDMILWNGPLGLFEKSPFDFGTRNVAEFVAERTQNNGLISIIGGGDTGFAMKKFNVFDKMTYVSTAGGAFLNYIENENCPALAAIQKNS